MLFQRGGTMRNGQRVLECLADSADLSGEPLARGSLVEIAEDRRVLIESHCGITQYSRERICVKVKFGIISVCGRNLELIRMTKEQLIIAGKIEQVELMRRGR